MVHCRSVIGSGAVDSMFCAYGESGAEDSGVGSDAGTFDGVLVVEVPDEDYGGG